MKKNTSNEYGSWGTRVSYLRALCMSKRISHATYLPE